ncbi:FAD-dependent oxidoreductase [Mycolicibacterium sp. 050232]|uniref:hydroxysqualene dehydroxylase n=1 Tax=Mycolicibacterium sp. 050232 TaxID=3113982 RepID=UPI002E27C9D8|nr:FAD-dependent oxidoreductase [Mycolicibacterium sp. 050232]MED5810923.1 FAD-dependent oxidoreductase [Mycolicibacterium sp. 050232]
MTSVAVLGGGIAGLSAAHELGERGFDVTVFEASMTFGGKARSMDVPDSAVGNRKPLPGEHGFRFFPGFYRHIVDTMSRIPDGQRTAADHLVAAKGLMLAQDSGRNEILTLARRPASLEDLGVAVQFIRQIGENVKVPPHELAVFLTRMLTLLTSCDERRLDQCDKVSWWVYMDAERKSPAFQKFLADGMTRALVAAQAREMSARTGGLILWQLVFDLIRVEGRLPQLLDGPTSEVWIDPWAAHLRNLGVTIRSGCKVTEIDCDGRRITGVTVMTTSGPERIVADHYVSAMPKEKLQLLLTPALTAAEPRLAALEDLHTRWMNGAMFYLDKDVPLPRGHAIFVDSEWALTAVSQAQFWRDINLQQRGDGQVEGILSVDISDWETVGRKIEKTARTCSKEEIRDEVWAQLVAHIDDGSLDVANVLDFFLDPAIVLPDPAIPATEAPPTENLEPLLVNTKGSWADRPDAVTRIPNFFLASDYVRTFTDLATMEGANEAARRAVNGILDATGSPERRCDVWKLNEPRVLAPFRSLDKLWWRLGRGPVKPPFRVDLDGALEPIGLVARGVLALLRRFGR